MYQHLSRVVIVDDAENDAVILGHLLEKSGVGATPQVFETGEAALQFFATLAAQTDPKTPPTIAFIDVWLPGLNGFELLKWIRQQEGTHGLVVVMLSGSDEPRNLGKAAQLGADAYTIKFPSPTGIRDLLDEIRRSWNQPLPRRTLPVSCNLLHNFVA